MPHIDRIVPSSQHHITLLYIILYFLFCVYSHNPLFPLTPTPFPYNYVILLYSLEDLDVHREEIKCLKKKKIALTPVNLKFIIYQFYHLRWC